MNIRLITGLSAILAVVIDGGYALLCTATDTWSDAPPSAHVTALALATIGAVIAAIVIDSIEHD
jgi:hypothetical protein